MRRVLKWIFGILLVMCAAIGVTWAISAPTEEQRGIWRSETGGMILDISPLRAIAYRETTNFCLQTVAFPAHMQAIKLLEGARIENVGDQLYLHIDGALDPTVFNKADSLPAACTTADPATATAETTFDAYWEAMNEHYAFFDLHGVDWDSRRALAPAPDATNAELTEAMLAAADGLDDGHIHFGDGNVWHSPAQPPAWLGTQSRDSLHRTAQFASAARLYEHGSAPILFGLREDGIGYIQIRAMSVTGRFGESQQDAATRIMGDILKDVATAETLIIDVRYNPGGSDSVAFGFASHFAPAQTPVFTKTSRDGDGQGPAFEAILAPASSTPPPQNVILLTSRLTGSAAEIFTLAMRTLPQVTVMGENTSGGLSDVLGFKLPNGWDLGLSNQTYTAADGQVYEAVGIPPDEDITFNADNIAAGTDTVLLQAIRAAN